MIIIPKGQVEQLSAEWYKLRDGVITGSRADDFCCEGFLAPIPKNFELKGTRSNYEVFKDGELFDIPSHIKNKADIENFIRKSLPRKKSESYKGYILDLIAEIDTNREDKFEYEAREGVPQKWGLHYEDHARSDFEFMTSFPVEEVGFVYKNESKRFGCSPDGFVNNRQGIIEIKCPFATKVHVDFLLNRNIKDEYVKQMQFNMWITDAEYCYFISYDPRVKNLPNLDFVKIDRDEDYMRKFEESSVRFLKDYDEALEKLGLVFGSQWKKKDD